MLKVDVLEVSDELNRLVARCDFRYIVALSNGRVGKATIASSARR